MNERIVQIWNNAAESAAYLSGNDNSWETQVHFIDKFAELIIKECAKRSGELGQPEIGEGIMKHFGVE